MFDLTGKCALVTGASGGIGAAIAEALHGAGATVGLSGTRTAPLEELAAKLGARAHVLPCNLGDAEAVEALPKQAAAAMGGIDILVNNAGITRDNLFMRMSDEEWQSVLDDDLLHAICDVAHVSKSSSYSRDARPLPVFALLPLAGRSLPHASGGSPQSVATPPAKLRRL